VKLICITIPRPTCGRDFSLNAEKRFRLRQNPDRRTYCSRQCRHEDMFGSRNPKWRGGRRVNDGYIYLYTPDHPHATQQGYVLEHRLVMEDKLGRLLSPEESVHHIDGNTQHNDPNNLQLMTDEATHRRLHAKYRTRDCNGRFSGRAQNVAAYH
jgi:hypothetical protein